jgi:hypothetical protein
VIASSTLFIYLTHFQFQSVADHVSRHPLFEVALALAGGVLVAYCWNTLIRLLFTRRNKHNPARGADLLSAPPQPELTCRHRSSDCKA